MVYVDGFVLSVPKKNLKEYVKMSKGAGKMWMEYGAWKYVECVGDDMKSPPNCWNFPDMAKPKSGEVVLFSFIVYENKKHRDSVNKKLMADPRMKKMPKKMPFDIKRMAYGGFASIVDL